MEEFNPRAEVRKILRERMTGDLLEVGPDTYHAELRAAVEGWRGLLEESLERLVKTYAAYSETAEDGPHADLSFKKRADARIREIRDGVVLAADSPFEPDEIFSVLRSLPDPGYVPPTTRGPWATAMTTMVALFGSSWFARALLDGEPFSADTLGVLTLTWGKLASAAERDIRDIEQVYPRATATRGRLAGKGALEKQSARRAEVERIAKAFKEKGSLIRHIYDQLQGTEHEASMDTIRKDLIALREEGRLPPE